MLNQFARIIPIKSFNKPKYCQSIYGTIMLNGKQNIDQSNILCRTIHMNHIKRRDEINLNFSPSIRWFSDFNKDAQLLNDSENSDFMNYFPEILKIMEHRIKEIGMNRLVTDHVTQLFEYNILRGKFIRGHLTVATCKKLLDDSKLDANELNRIYCLGWIVEMLQSWLLIMDDLMDHSETRRGQLCWYKKDNIKMGAINDGLMMENAMYYLLRTHFGDKDYYVRLVDLFHEMVQHTTYGQYLDLATATADVTSFNMCSYELIVVFKTVLYTFYLPVALGLNMAGIKTGKIHKQVRDLSIDLGLYFQIQDDFLDCFGDPTITGKIGTDIADNKCSWLAVKCIERATTEQKQIMIDCYGKNDPEKIAAIKKLYRDLELPRIYGQYEKAAYQRILNNIQALDDIIPKDIFYAIINQIHGRSK